jgi:hypothetical protein
MAMTQVDEILADIAKALRPVLEAALADVRDASKRDAAIEFKAKLNAMFDSGPGDRGPLEAAAAAKPEKIQYAPPPPRKASKGRATPGTVKPQILDAVRQMPEGTSTKDIATLTGFKYNSVRGTLWLLKKEGQVMNKDEKWFPVSPERKLETDLELMLQ